jgi:cell surface protein SprA
MFNPDEYSLWKDSVLQSIRDLGNPMEYKQTFSANYTIPFNMIPAINFIAGALTFNSGYNWQRGATLEDPSIDIGNIINNNRTFGVNNIKFNLVNFYNKFKFLEEVNKKYTANKTSSTSVKNRARTQNAQAAQAQAAKKPPLRKKFEGDISLNLDSATQVKHQLNSKRLRITARDENGRLYALKYKTVNENSIEIKNKDSVNLKITILELPPLNDLKWYKILQGTTRGLMMVREVGFTYNESFDMMIPNFDPDIGNFFGQGSTPIGNAPGLDFAFGLAGEDYVEKAAKNNWLIKNESNITPAMFNKLQTFNFTATVEPIVGMRITLKAIRSKTDRSEVYFMYGGMPRKFNGNFKMTTVALSGIFESSNANDGYYSKSFETFLNNREVVAGRLEQQYGKTHYPNTGFLEGSHFAGQPYDPSIGSVDPNSTDVLIPAFIAAYTGQNPGSIGLSAFPSLKKLLPNWDIKYDGLMQIPFINKRFKSFTIDHNYVCYYNVGAFNSFLNWVEADESGIGFVESVISNNPYPSSAFDITSINITEAFKPLIGAKTTLQNNMSLSLLYNIEKNVNLNVSAYQIVEMKKKDITLDAGYRIENFNKILKIKKTGGANFNNELNVKAGITYTLMQNLIRKIEDHYTQATSGNSQFTIKLSADYNLSKMITLQAYYDKQISTPLVSATAYPMSKSDFGISIRVSLQR